MEWKYLLEIFSMHSREGEEYTDQRSSLSVRKA